MPRKLDKKPTRRTEPTAVKPESKPRRKEPNAARPERKYRGPAYRPKARPRIRITAPKIRFGAGDGDGDAPSVVRVASLDENGNLLSKQLGAGSRDGHDLWIPRHGYFDVWDNALATAGSALIEALLKGDSMTYGQTSTGGSGYNASNYSYAQKLRALSIAAGIADGGVGIRSYQDSAALNTIDAIDAVAGVGTFVQHTGVGLTNGSNVVTDTSITGSESGRRVVHTTGMAAGYIGQATAGVGYTVVSTQGGSVAVNASATTTTAVNIYSDGFVAPASSVGLGPLSGYDFTPPAITGTGYSTTIQGKQATCRLGYMKYAAGGGSFTYTVNGGAPTTVSCSGSFTGPAYVSITNPSPGSVCSIKIVTTVAGTIEIWPEWVNAHGLVWHKDGLSTQKLAAMFPGQNGASSLGFGYGEVYANGGLTNTHGAGPRNLKLAVLWAGINDQNAATTQALAEAAVQTNATGIGIFGALCDNLGIPGVVMCPNYWSYANALLFAPYFREAHFAATRAAGLAWFDAGQAVLPISSAATYGWTFGSVPHFNQAGYDAVANGLWTKLLNPATAVR